MMKNKPKEPALRYIQLPLSEEYQDEIADFTPEESQIFLMLLYYCGTRPNGGRIENAKNWTKEQWLKKVRINNAPEERPNCWHYEGEALIFDLYPVEGEEKALKRRRENAEKGKKSAEMRRAKSAAMAGTTVEATVEAAVETTVEAAVGTTVEAAVDIDRDKVRDIYPLKGDISRELAPGHADAAGAALEEQPLTPEEQEAFFRELREELKADQ